MSVAVESAPLREPRRSDATASDRLAVRLAIAGASLGILVGLVELTVGPSIRDWVGDKQDTTRLGLATLFLSACALLAASVLRRAHIAGARRHRVAVVLGLMLPALVCFSTAGRLWYVPGVLLLSAGALVASGTRRAELVVAVDARHWRLGLLVGCGTLYVFLGATALGFAGALGILGGAAIWASAFAASRGWRRPAYALVVAGAVPFAALTWWSVVTPVLAVVTLLTARGAISSSRSRPVRQ